MSTKDRKIKKRVNLEQTSKTPSVRLTNKGYIIPKVQVDSETLARIRSDLTVKPRVHPDFNAGVQSFRVYRENANKLYIPRFYGLKTFPTWKPANQLRDGEPIDLTFNGQLRPKQKPAVKAVLKGFKNIKTGGGGGLLVAGCGAGKTSMSLYVLSALKVKTIVIVHQEFLIHQWKERIEQFLPGARVGLIQGKIFDIEDKDIVFCMLQSLSQKYYPPEAFYSFGLSIYDECHHLAAETFSKALPKTATKYLLGLSATPKRADGLSKVFEWYLGPVLYKSVRVTNYLVKVKRIFFHDPRLRERRNMQGRIFTPNMISDVVKHKERNRIIVDEVFELAKLGRNVMILSERRPHLKALKEALDKRVARWVETPTDNKDDTDENGSTAVKRTQITSGYYIGGLKQKILKETEETDVIFATMAMAKEGLDIKKLDTLVLATSKPEITQAVGRILRKDVYGPNDLPPLVVDMVDDYSVFRNQAKKRLTFYRRRENGYVVEDYRVEGKQVVPVETNQDTGESKTMASQQGVDDLFDEASSRLNKETKQTECLLLDSD